MNFVILLLAGGIVGSLGYYFTRFTDGPSIVVCAVVGAVGGAVGGGGIAPMFNTAAAKGELTVSTIFFAIVVAGAALAIGTIAHRRLRT